MKKWLKVVLWIVCIVLQEIIVIFGAFFFYDYSTAKQRIEELAEEPYFTRFELTAEEVELFLGYYGGTIVPKWDKQWYLPHWPDYSYYRFYSQGTEPDIKVAVLNYWLFIEKNNYPQEIDDIVTKYGFAKTNQITKDWVFDNNRQSLELAIAMDNIGKDLKDQELVDEAYHTCMIECNITAIACTQIVQTPYSFLK